MHPLSPVRPDVHDQRGFSALELLIALAIGGMLVAIAVPTYQSYMLRVKIAAAIVDISNISAAIDKYTLRNFAAPPDLATLQLDNVLDPWGHPYFYLPFDDLHGHGAQRKDKHLVPINSRYDLYSAGPDGRTAAPLTARDSKDDIILANDGSFIGLASDY